MLHTLHLLLASGSSAGDPSSLNLGTLGPFAAFGALALAYIYDLRGQRSDLQAIIKAKDETIAEQASKLESLAERALPLLSENTKALSEVLDDRRRPDR